MSEALPAPVPDPDEQLRQILEAVLAEHFRPLVGRRAMVGLLAVNHDGVMVVQMISSHGAPGVAAAAGSAQLMASVQRAIERARREMANRTDNPALWLQQVAGHYLYDSRDGRSITREVKL